MVDLYELTAEMCTLTYIGCQASFHVAHDVIGISDFLPKVRFVSV